MLLHLSFLAYVMAVDNGLGLSPAMGFNTWNKFACNINEQLIRDTADAMVSSGLSAAGYEYLNLDDCWQISRDPVTSEIQADNNTFPSGMMALSDYVHSKGLKFGLYTDSGYLTCQKRPGSLHHEHIDALTYAKWGIDYIKVDNCYNNGESPKLRYPVFHDAFNASGHEIYFSMCEWGVEFPAAWAPEIANSWRTTGDIADNWDSVMYNLDINAELYPFAKPGAWNDPDMLEVGNGGLTTEEDRSHFSLWSIMKAPLLIGCDITKISSETLSILTNPEVISVNQDPNGIQGRRIRTESSNGKWTVRAGTCQSPFNNQLWKYNTTSKAVYTTITDPASGDQTYQCLTVEGSRGAGPVSLETCSDGVDLRQQWMYNSKSSELANPIGGDCLGINYGGHVFGPSVSTSICIGGPAQQWIFNGGGGFLQNVLENKPCLSSYGDLEVWSVPYSGNQRDDEEVVLLFNRASTAQNMRIIFSDLQMIQGNCVTVRDLWLQKDLGKFTNIYQTSAPIPSHGVQMLKFTPC